MPRPNSLKHLAAATLCALAVAGCDSFQGETRDLSFEGADGAVLQGTLVLPPGAEDVVPVMIQLHGAEAGTRGRFIYAKLANVFLEHGIGTFVYDKRGAGESEGDHDDKTYGQLVEDAVAAVALLRGRPEVDPERIAVMGASESGWLTPEIAERSGGLAFVINKVGAPLSVRETWAWEVYNDLQADGVSEPEAREQADVLLRLWNYYVAPTPEERAWLDETLGRWVGREGSILPERPTPKSEDALADIGYDPGPYLERLGTPMLYLYGSEDINIPARESVARLEELVRAGRPVSFHVFEGEGHELGGVRLWPPGYHFADGYEERITAFALRHVGGG